MNLICCRSGYDKKRRWHDELPRRQCVFGSGRSVSLLSLYIRHPNADWSGLVLAIKIRAPRVPCGIEHDLETAAPSRCDYAVQIVHLDIISGCFLVMKFACSIFDLSTSPASIWRAAPKPRGTIRYMAPEPLHGSAASVRTKVLALAITLHLMFSTAPYPFGRHKAVLLARLRPDLPCWLGQCLARACSHSSRALR